MLNKDSTNTSHSQVDYVPLAKSEEEEEGKDELNVGHDDDQEDPVHDERERLINKTELIVPKSSSISKEDSSSIGIVEYEIGTRGQVNGAAVAAGVAGLVCLGPLSGLVAATAASHLAANKEGKVADLIRQSGDTMVRLGRKISNKPTVVVADENDVDTPHNNNNQQQMNLFDKSTAKLVQSAQWIEQKVASKKEPKIDAETALTT